MTSGSSARKTNGGSTRWPGCEMSVGVQTTSHLLERVRARVDADGVKEPPGAESSASAAQVRSNSPSIWRPRWQTWAKKSAPSSWIASAAAGTFSPVKAGR